MRKTLYINSISGVLLLVFSSVLVFIAIPLFIRKLGTEMYGVYALLMLLGNINNFANLGITAALIKSLSEQGRCKQSEIDIIATYIIFCVIITPVTLALLFFQDFCLANIFSVPTRLITADVKFFYVCLVLANAVTFIGQTGPAILDAVQKIYITNILQFVYNVSYWGLFLIVLLFSKSMAVLGMVVLGVATLWFCLVLFYSTKTWGKISPRITLPAIVDSLTKQFSYGSKLYMSGILNFIFEPFTKILISNFIGIREVGYFDIALRLKFYIWTVMQKIQYPLLPLLASLKDRNQIRKLVHDFEQKFFLILIPSLLVLIFAAHPFTIIWLGTGSSSELIATGIILITGGALIGIALGPNYLFLTIKGYPEKTIIMQFVNLAVNLIVFFGLKNVIGFKAALLGNFCALIASTFVNLYYQKKYLDSLVWDSFSQFLKVVVIFALTFAINLLAIRIVQTNLGQLIVVLGLNIVCPLFLYRQFRMITLDDIQTYLGKSRLTKPVSFILVKR